MGQQSLSHHCLPFAYLPSEASLSNRDSDVIMRVQVTQEPQVAGLRVPLGQFLCKSCIMIFSHAVYLAVSGWRVRLRTFMPD